MFMGVNRQPVSESSFRSSLNAILNPEKN